MFFCMPKSGLSHERAANSIARRNGAEYNKDKGPDVKTPFATIEVETEGTVRDGLRQLQGHRGPVYIAGSN